MATATQGYSVRKMWQCGYFLLFGLRSYVAMNLSQPRGPVRPGETTCGRCTGIPEHSAGGKE